MPDSLLKFLTTAGLGSRRKVARAVKEGRVQRNGEIAFSFCQEVDPAKDLILFDGKQVNKTSGKFVYLMLNKPAGVLSTTHDDRGRETVMDLIPPKYKIADVHPVGRLDIDSHGLILLTNDGALTYLMTHPRFEKEKEYLVRLDRILAPDDRQRFQRGLALEDGLTSPTRVAEVSVKPPVYRVTLHEGRKRQIRRMFLFLGYAVQDLKRTRMGNLRLGKLEERGMRELEEAEIIALKKEKEVHLR